MTEISRWRLVSASGIILLTVAVGCHSPAGMAIQLVGKAVDCAETMELEKELVGRRVDAADAKLGTPKDVWRQVGGPNEWRVYPAPLDVVGNQRCVVQVARRKIVSVTKVQFDGSGVELARKLMYDQKVRGKTPRECESALNMGPPVVTARSEMTGLLAQLYDAKMVPGVGSPQYCRLRFDANERCSEIAVADVKASSSSDPTK